LLDAACGNGRLYRGLARGGLLDRVEYIGADVTPKMVEAASRLMPGVEIDQADVEALPYEDDRFDVAVAQHILRHLDRYERAVDELLRVARVVVIVEKDVGEGRDRRGTYHDPEIESTFWVNAWEPGRLKEYARSRGARMAFALNDARIDDPDGQFIYVFAR
jgi:SAM-dependent methyltransferase